MYDVQVRDGNFPREKNTLFSQRQKDVYYHAKMEQLFIVHLAL